MKSARLLVVCLFVCSSPCWAAADDDDDDNAPKPIMVDVANGWWVRDLSEVDDDLGYAIQHTTDGGKHWQDVSPTALRPKKRRGKPADPDPDPPGFSVVDAHRAWVQIGNDVHDLLLEYTDDGGKHWQRKTAHIAGFKWGATAATSFVDQDQGFLLDMGEPAAGKMDKALYRTQDGSAHWNALDFRLPNDIIYPTGLTFRTREEGWITAQIRGEIAVPLFRSTDGGHTWNVQTLPYPKDAKEVHGSTYPPAFFGPDKKRGRLPVSLSYSDPSGADGHWIIYETEDGGATWHLPAPR